MEWDKTKQCKPRQYKKIMQFTIALMLTEGHSSSSDNILNSENNFVEDFGELNPLVTLFFF